jgi:hypothetical protein
MGSESNNVGDRARALTGGVVGEPETLQQGHDGLPLGDQRDEPESAAAGARQHIEVEGAPQKRRPIVPRLGRRRAEQLSALRACGRRRLRNLRRHGEQRRREACIRTLWTRARRPLRVLLIPSVHLLCLASPARATTSLRARRPWRPRHDGLAEAVRRSKQPPIPHERIPRRRHEQREAREQLRRREHQVRSPEARILQLIGIPPVLRFLQPLEAQRGPRAVPQQTLQPLPVPRRHHRTGMQAVPRVGPRARVPPGSPGRRTHHLTPRSSTWASCPSRSAVCVACSSASGSACTDCRSASKRPLSRSQRVTRHSSFAESSESSASVPWRSPPRPEAAWKQTEALAEPHHALPPGRPLPSPTPRPPRKTADTPHACDIRERHGAHTLAMVRVAPDPEPRHARARARPGRLRREPRGVRQRRLLRHPLPLERVRRHHAPHQQRQRARVPRPDHGPRHGQLGADQPALRGPHHLRPRRHATRRRRRHRLRQKRRQPLLPLPPAPRRQVVRRQTRDRAGLRVHLAPPAAPRDRVPGGHHGVCHQERRARQPGQAARRQGGARAARCAPRWRDRPRLAAEGHGRAHPRREPAQGAHRPAPARRAQARARRGLRREGRLPRVLRREARRGRRRRRKRQRRRGARARAQHRVQRRTFALLPGRDAQRQRVPARLRPRQTRRQRALRPRGALRRVAHLRAAPRRAACRRREAPRLRRDGGPRARRSLDRRTRHGSRSPSRSSWSDRPPTSSTSPAPRCSSPCAKT